MFLFIFEQIVCSFLFCTNCMFLFIFEQIVRYFLFTIFSKIKSNYIDEGSLFKTKYITDKIASKSLSKALLKLYFLGNMSSRSFLKIEHLKNCPSI